MNCSRWRFSALMVTALIGFAPLAACKSVVDSVDGHLTELNSSTDNFRNQAILLNIIRSKHGAPLSFVSVQQIQTQYNADISYSLPSYQLGPLKVQSGRPFGIGNTTFGGDFQNQTQPTFNNLIGKDFNDAITSPIQRLRLFRFVRDGYPLDLLLLLTTSRVKLTVRGIDVVIQNQDLDKGVVCPLQKEGTTTFVSVAKCLEIIRSHAVDAGIDLETTKVIKTGIGSDDKDSSKKSTGTFEETEADFCFTNPQPFDRNYYAKIGFPNGPPGKVCGGTASKKGAGIANVELRSLAGVYRFIGEYLRSPDLANDMVVRTTRGDEPLLVILENSTAPCFVDVNYLNKHYCVPEVGSGQSKQVFSILDQLQNVNTDISKIPQPSVLTLNGRIR